jgi:transcription elongation factor Elf1
MAPNSPSFQCPSCNHPISIELKDILEKGNFDCPNCGTHFTIGKENPMDTLDDLKKLNDLLQNYKP